MHCPLSFYMHFFLHFRKCFTFSNFNLCGEWLQVRFHPLHPQILASGSLDQKVRLWDANTSECIISHHFCIFTYCRSLVLFSKLLLLLLLKLFVVFLYLLGSLMNLWVFSHRSTHCIHCFSCQRGNNSRCIRPQGSLFFSSPENLPCGLNL